jgi:hypothetical protein
MNSELGNGPSLLEGPGTNSAGTCAYALDQFQTPLFDLTKTYSGIEVIPARPGYYAYPLSFVWIIESFAGTQVTPVVFQMGSNPAHNNILPSQSNPSNANVNAAVPPSTAIAATVTVATGTQYIANAPVYMDITSPASGTGGFACTARLAYYIFWIPFGSA